MIKIAYDRTTDPPKTEDTKYSDDAPHHISSKRGHDQLIDKTFFVSLELRG